LERGALKLDLSSDFTISTKAYYTTNLLPLRMALLHLDPTEIARADPRPYFRRNQRVSGCADIPKH
jgi:hypothetical protein